MDTQSVSPAENYFPERVRPIVFITVLWFLLFAGVGHFWMFWERSPAEGSFQQKVWSWLFSGATYVVATLVTLALAFRYWNAGSLRFSGLSDVRKGVHCAAGFVMAAATIGLFLSGWSLSSGWGIAGIKTNYPIGEFFFLLATVAMGVLSEELFFRGYLLQALERVAGTTWAIVLSSLLFAVMHLVFRGQGSISRDIFIVLPHLVAGFWFGAGFVASRSLWLPIGLHFGWNLCWGVFFDTPSFGTYTMMRYTRISFKMPWSFTQDGLTAFQAILCSLMTIVLLIYIARRKKPWVKMPSEIRWS